MRLERVNYTKNLFDTSSCLHWVLQDNTDVPLGTDNEYGADGMQFFLAPVNILPGDSVLFVEPKEYLLAQYSEQETNSNSRYWLGKRWGIWYKSSSIGK